MMNSRKEIKLRISVLNIIVKGKVLTAIASFCETVTNYFCQKENCKDLEYDIFMYDSSARWYLSATSNTEVDV